VRIEHRGIVARNATTALQSNLLATHFLELVDEVPLVEPVADWFEAQMHVLAFEVPLAGGQVQDYVELQRAQTIRQRVN
jgi:hypothetical protein